MRLKEEFIALVYSREFIGKEYHENCKKYVVNVEQDSPINESFYTLITPEVAKAMLN